MRVICTVVGALAVYISVAAISAPASQEQALRPSNGKTRRPDLQVISPGSATPENFICATRRYWETNAEFQDAIDRGEIPDPRLRTMAESGLPPILGSLYRDTVSGLDLYLYPDVNGLLTTNFSDGALFNLMTQGANELITQHGDQYDFVAFWLNFEADHQIGAAFYLGLENDITGLGEGIYNARPSFGLQGTNCEGYVMMWNEYAWEEGTYQFSAFTRLVLGQEFEHRWGMFLNSFDPFLPLQGEDDGFCGRSAHWNFRVDGQGSGMEIAEWVGGAIASKTGGTLTFNTDNGGVFSYPDLYLMGYVSPMEMDDSSSQLRYMDEHTTCSGSYGGPMTIFTSTDIIGANGVRVPPSSSAQKHYKTGWVMFYLPSSPPDQTDLTHAINIMIQHQIDWANGVLNRGTQDNSIDEGHFSTTGTRIGQGPQTLQFDYDTTFTSSAWKWYFGDGDSSILASPSHTYSPGVYTVELRNTTPHDVRQTLKRDHIILWADTLKTFDVEVPNDTGSFYWEIHATNYVPIKDMTVPVTISDVPVDIELDSIVATGCRTEYFELKQIGYDERWNGKIAYRLKADNGGGSAPLTPGTGPIARVWLHTNSGSGDGDTITMSVGQLGSQTFREITVGATFMPQFVGGAIIITAQPCLCPCHADPFCDGSPDILDVSDVINEAFRGGPATIDATCAHVSRNDVDCDCSVSITDVVKMIDVAFRGIAASLRFCDACAQPCP